MKLGCASVLFSSFHHVPDVDMAHGLRLAADAGFECIEYNDQSLPLFFEASDAELRDVRMVADGLGLDFWSVHMPCLNRFALASSDPAVMRVSRDTFERTVEVCALMGARQLVVHLLDTVGEEKASAEDRLRMAKETLAWLRPKAMDAGVTLALENMGRSQSCALMVDLCHELGPDGMGVCLDIGHAHASGESPADEACVAGDLLCTLHIHDNNNSGSGRDEHLPPGFGNIDFPALMQALDDVGYDDVFMLEAMRSHPAVKGMSVEEIVRISAERARDVCTRH